MMTKKHAATLLILMLVGLTGLVNAQVSTLMKAQIPFDYVANGKTMSKGECVIAVVTNGSTFLTIRSGERTVVALSIVDGSPNTSKQTALVFHRYGNRYFLAGVKRAGAIGYSLPTSRHENELRAQNVREEVLTLLASAN